MQPKVAAFSALALVAGLALVLPPPLHAVSLSSLLGNQQNENDNIKKIHVADLVALMHDPKSHVLIYDANLHDVRAKYGIIPGAKLLSSSDEYDVAAELPANKNAKLVFYCTNLH